MNKSFLDLLDSQYKGMWKYKKFLPINDERSIVTLDEGNTPLIRSTQNFKTDVYIKDETRNPTGAMKDRALSVAFSKAKNDGIKQSIIASTGNAAISAAAYAARANVENIVLVPKGTPMERLVAMYMYGSKIIQVNASIEELMDVVNQASSTFNFANVSTVKEKNPFQAEGPKTIAFEIIEQLKKSPDYVMIPVGGGGTLSAIWKGFKELVDVGVMSADTLPKIIAVHHENYNSLEIALNQGLNTKQQLLDLSKEMDSTKPCIAKNIEHTYCMDGVEALQAIRESGGTVVSVSEQQIMEAQINLSKIDGIYVEPSAAASLAGAAKLENSENLINKTIISLVTGSGFKESNLLVGSFQPKFENVDLNQCIEYLSNMAN